MRKEQPKWKGWPVKKKDSDLLANWQVENLKKAKANRWENEVADWLKELTPGMKWTRQARWGWRFFDFWNAAKGVAIEVDGGYHSDAYQKQKDEFRDGKNHIRSGILVFRVPNGDLLALKVAAVKIRKLESWEERRIKLGVLTKAEKIRIAKREIEQAKARMGHGK